MPKPPYTRRVFLTRGLTMLAAGVTVPSFINRTAYAVGRPFDQLLTQPDSGTDGKVLVVVQLSGGNDGLNTVIPFGDDAYYRARPQIAVPADQTLRLTDHLGLHPQLQPLRAMYEEGWMSIVQGVGYPNPNRSHFRSMDIWHTANPREEAARSGWLGRFFDAQCNGIDPTTPTTPTAPATRRNNAAARRNQQPQPADAAVPVDPTIGITIGGTSQLAMRGENVMPLSFERPDDYRYAGDNLRDFLALNAPGDVTAADPDTEEGHLDFLTRTAMDAQVSSEQVTGAVARHNPRTEYPRGRFGDSLRTVAAMIRGGLATRVYYVSLGGFDTHAGQPGTHDRLLGELASGVQAFLTDLKQQGNDDRVLLMTFSEFGRRVSQNASNGTDHGAAAPMFFFGKGIHPGLMGQHPSLHDLENGDLRYNIDFRSCYAAVLQQWLDASPQVCSQILGGRFQPLPLTRG